MLASTSPVKSHPSNQPPDDLTGYHPNAARPGETGNKSQVSFQQRLEPRNQRSRHLPPFEALCWLSFISNPQFRLHIQP